MKYLLRSMLFVPAHSEKFIEKALDCDADAIIFDMEDAVPQIKRKEAREILAGYLNKKAFAGRLLFIRVNELETEDLEDDLKLIKDDQILGIVAPKVRNTTDIDAFVKKLEMCEANAGLKEGSIKLLPLIETAEAVLNVQSIAGCNDRIIALLFGGEDYLDSIYGRHDEPPKAFEVPRAMVVMAARMHGILPIDTPYLDLKNEEGFKTEENEACSMGYAGILLVNPRQIPWAHECFSPSEEEVIHATDIMNAVEDAKKQGGSIATLHGKMIGPPMRKRAQKVVEIAELIRAKDK